MARTIARLGLRSSAEDVVRTVARSIARARKKNENTKQKKKQASG